MIRVICTGKLKEKYLVNMVEDYLKRINKYHKLEVIEVKDSNLKEEGERIISKLSNRSFKIALTIQGNKLSSLEFSDLIDKSLMNYGNIDFIIGGSNGLSKNVLNLVNYEMSFSDLTFPHGLFRGILLEQIYRGFKIINNDTYHK
jgi:23S rRNA (pseudouridine1915-N3)-methyltransferase